jgi:uncharacterized protein YbjQ (UPF0145 family)
VVVEALEDKAVQLKPEAVVGIREDLAVSEIQRKLVVMERSLMAEQ